MSLLLEEEISQSIKQLGPIRFDEFMKIALFHSDYGFYSQNKKSQISQFGTLARDYISYSPEELCQYPGENTAKAIHNLATNNQKIPFQEIPFKIREIIGTKQTLANNLLDYLKHAHKDTYERISEYQIIDPFNNLGEEDINTLKGIDDKLIISRINPLELNTDPFNGFVIVNQYFSKLPVNLIVFKGKEPNLLFVSESKDHLFEIIPLPCEDPNILAFIEKHGYNVHKNKFQYQENSFDNSIPHSLDISKVYEKISKSISFGGIISIDYGYKDIKQHLKDSKPSYLRNNTELFRVNQGYLNIQYPFEFSPIELVGEQSFISALDFNQLINSGEENQLSLSYFGCPKGITNPSIKKPKSGYLILVQSK
ncbi:MAG TPA: SAM-dependent methyltransferase [Candidatus Woesearchaeota archaeon]|jgi:SAM-dependent MidA family methyltransferase|nr:SAM-dependent methyltransferase [Candidatus Woesearchaeota archaeon]